MKFTKALPLLVSCSMILIVTLNSQPTVDWRNYSWVQHDYNNTNSQVGQRQSDYDWWYDHCTGYQNLNHIGYIACGVGKYRVPVSGQFNPGVLTYDERGPLIFGQYKEGCTYDQAPLMVTDICEGYDYDNFENPQSGKLGLTFNTIGNINPNGTLKYLVTMNYGGEYTRTKQLKDGTFLTIGHTKSTRKKNGLPLYYNPTNAHPTNQFNYDEMFANGICHHNRLHWDIMKFDGKNSTCLFNFIYGIYDFVASPGSFLYSHNDLPNCPASTYTINEKQLSFFSTGLSFDFVQEPITGNIAVVGFQTNKDAQYADKAAIIKIDNDGIVLAQQFIDNSPSPNLSTARAIEFVKIGVNDYYFVAVTRMIQPGSLASEVDIYMIPTALNNPNPVVIKKYTTFPGRGCTVWSMKKKGNNLYVLLLTNAKNVWSTDNNAELRLEILDLTTFATVPQSNPFSVAVQAYDLKARMIELSNGNFGIVSSVRKNDWSTICHPTVIPQYIAGCPSAQANTGFWNTDTYVAEVTPNGQIIWENNYDVDSPFGCHDFPDYNSRGGNPKRQECMYGISEAPDNGIVLSGNSSDNVDDNYMIKLNPPLPISTICQCYKPTNINVKIGSNNFNMTNGQVLLTNTINKVPVNIFYDGLCFNNGSCPQNTNEVKWKIFKTPSFNFNTILGYTQNIAFEADFRNPFPFAVKVQYRIEIKHTCAGIDCGTTNLIIKKS